jgi:hypothetical protein
MLNIPTGPPCASHQILRTECLTLRTVALMDLDDPGLKPLFLSVKKYHLYPLAYYSQYWGKGQSALLDQYSLFRPTNRDTLYFFKQYGYMDKRIDGFRSYRKGLEREPWDLPDVVIIGTPGIGESFWSLYPVEELTAFLKGKTSFLNYYLARELSQEKPVIYINARICYIFKGSRVHVREEVPTFGDGFPSVLLMGM